MEVIVLYLLGGLGISGVLYGLYRKFFKKPDIPYTPPETIGQQQGFIDGRLASTPVETGATKPVEAGIANTGAQVAQVGSSIAGREANIQNIQSTPVKPPDTSATGAKSYWDTIVGNTPKDK